VVGVPTQTSEAGLNPILEARGVSKRFGAVTAADNINVAVAPHSVIGLIGTNGAGKTTFVNMITGYLKPSSGTIHFAGKDITGREPRQITRLGVARSFQIPQLYDSLTVAENLAVALGIVLRNARGSMFGKLPRRVPGYGEPDDIVAEQILERFHLQAYRDQPARALPQGVRKQLDIALALAGKPKVLLLDEPTSGVAAEEKFGIMDMIMQAVRAEQVTALFVEHDMEIVARYAQRVLAFYDGRIIADETPQEVLADPEVQRYVIGGKPTHA
jgi:branched-chain amino acid transport system ATP-binding protein